MPTIINLTLCQVCNEVYRGFFPKAGPLGLSLPFHYLNAIGDIRAVQQSTSTNYLAVTQASWNIFKDHQI